MNPGDEVDDNIWTRRPRNRLQPGQTAAPPRTVVSAAGGSDRASPSPASPKVSTAAPAQASRAQEASVSLESPLERAAGAAGASSAGETGPSQSAASNPRSPRSPTQRDAQAQSAEPVPSLPTQTRQAGAGTHAPRGWSIALATFSGDDHRAVAEAACRHFAAQVPDLSGAFVRSTPSGSVVLWGSFEGPRDPLAKPTIERLKQITFGDARPFARAMLTRVDQFTEEEMHPWDLRQVRRMHPRVRIIYTLQVAAWSDLGSGALTLEQIQRSAEAYCRQLRAQGVDAWFHHDADLRTSIVTVGVFDHRAYDPQSTLFAPEVEAMRRRFPTSLLNGEELLLKPDPSRPNHVVPQPSRLVEVPR